MVLYKRRERGREGGWNKEKGGNGVGEKVVYEREKDGGREKRREGGRGKRD